MFLAQSFQKSIGEFAVRTGDLCLWWVNGGAIDF